MIDYENKEANLLNIKKEAQLIKENISGNKKVESKYGKEKSLKLQQGNRKGYMQLIGQQNGEDIFNIVQIQNQEEDHPKQQFNKTQQLHEEIIKAQKKENKISQIQQGKSILKQISLTQKLQDNDVQEQIQENQQNSLSQSIQSDENSQQNQDLIHYHRTNVMYVPQRQQESQRPKNVQRKSEPLNVISQKPKKQKRVSFAAQEKVILNIDEIQKEPKKQNSIVPKTLQITSIVNQKNNQKSEIIQTPSSSIFQKEDKKQRIKKESIVNKVQINNELPGKISRFKLQRMKQKLQKQLKEEQLQ